MGYYAAFALGLAGSLHCVGMCGPLMLATGGGRAIAPALTYQAGRILVYMILGALLGSLGWGASLLNAQSGIAIVSGLLLIGFAIFRMDPGNLIQRNARFAAFQIRLRSWMSGFLERGGLAARFGLGCCNGLLPCGLVYIAIVGAANTGSPWSGAQFMLSFGLGTLPLLLVTLLAGHRLIKVTGRQFAYVTPILLAFAGCLLLYRGWVTSVPYEFSNFSDMANPPMCH